MQESLSVKRSTLSNHIKSTKHLDGKENLKRKEAREVSIATALKKYNETVNPKGQTLQDEHRVYRVKVMTAFLRAGVPISKLEHFRDILEENALSLTERRHMTDLIPFILREEKSRVLEQISGQHLSVIFDGTCRLGEVLAVVVRYITEEWKVIQCLVRLKCLAKSLTGEEVARELIDTLSIGYGVKTDNLLAVERRCQCEQCCSSDCKSGLPTDF